MTFTATDASGRTDQCTINIIVTDVTDPLVTCPGDQTESANSSCELTLPDYSSLATSSDNCGTVTLTQSPLSATVVTGSTTVTLTADDGNGNTSDCTFAVTVDDDTDPVAPTLSDVTGECTATVVAPTTTDNCSGTITGTTTDPLTYTAQGSYTITWNFDDGNGNDIDVTQAVVIDDVTDPLVTCPGDQTESANSSCELTLPDYSSLATSSDNCGTVTLTQSPLSATVVTGSTTVTLTADDGNGNTSDCTFAVTVDDDTDPVAPTLSDVTGECTATVVAPTTTDNCSGTITGTTTDPLTYTAQGSYTITWNFDDGNGNDIDVTQAVVIDDVTDPLVTCPGDLVVGSDINCEFTLIDYTIPSLATDNCGSVALTQDPAVGTIVNSLTTVTISSEDDFGNTSDCQFTLDLIDNIDPNITCIGNQTVLYDANCEYVLLDYTSNIISSDNCDPSVTIIQNPVENTLMTGSTTVSMTATDASGNSVACAFDILPIDVLPPTIDCPVTQVVDFDADCEFTLSEYSTLGLTNDNCSPVTVIQTPVAGTILSANTVITLTATDTDLNLANCTFLVVPEDNLEPSIVCPADFEVDFDENCDYTLVDYTAMGTTDDNCSTFFTVSQSPSLGTVVNAGSLVTLTVDDGNGNFADCSFNVTPVDNVLPIITCIDDQTVLLDEVCEFELDDYTGTSTTWDNCSNAVAVTQNPVVGTRITSATEVILMGDDGNGNTSNCTFMVFPEDDTDPIIVCPTSFDVQFESQGCSYIMSDLTGLVTANDNCASIVSITQDLAIGTFVTDTLSVMFTADDGNGNTASCSFQVNPSDETAPTAVCPADFTVDYNEDCAFELLNYESLVVANDNCGFALTSQNPVEGTLIMADTEILITIDDGNGNSTTCTFMVTPSDNTPPAIVCPNNLFEDLNENCQYELLDYTGLASAEDNCSPVVTIDQFPPAGIIILTPTVVNLAVTDNLGNEGECSFVISPEDNTLPEIAECPENQLAILDENCILAMPDFTGLIQAVDNCDIDLDYQQLPLAGSVIAGIGTYAVTVGVEDDADNYTSCEFDLIVSDESNPTVACPADQIIMLNANCLFELPDYTVLALGSDACGTVTLTQSPLPGSTITGQLNATIIAEDENGNSSNCTFFVDVLDMSASAVGTDITCQGGSDGTAMVSVIGGTAPYTEDWGGFNPLALSTGTYAVTISDANNCSTTTSVIIEDGPLVEIEIDPTGEIEICNNESITLDAGSGFAVYNWSTGATVQMITVSSEASYWVTVTSAEGCISNSDTADVIYYDDPLPMVISSVDGIISCSNDSASTYQWYQNGDLIVGATESYYCPIESGNYYVVITDSHGCTVSSLSEEYTYDENSPCATGIEEYGLTLDVFPNPSDGFFTVSYALDQQTDMLFAVYNLVGQRITEDELISRHAGTTVIDLSGVTDGIYTLRIAIGTKKVLHQRLVLVK
ncbi:HYR domain-containing protein [Flavobacteriales bacterium]|nr:HYR domain-containing protein [Flavobacteriales bacterium]